MTDREKALEALKRIQDHLQCNYGEEFLKDCFTISQALSPLRPECDHAPDFSCPECVPLEDVTTRAATPIEDCGCGHPDRHRQPMREELLGGGHGYYCRYCLRLRQSDPQAAALEVLKSARIEQDAYLLATKAGLDKISGDDEEKICEAALAIDKALTVYKEKTGRGPALLRAGVRGMPEGFVLTEELSQSLRDVDWLRGMRMEQLLRVWKAINAASTPARTQDGWKLVPTHGCYVKAAHPITVANPTKVFRVEQIRTSLGQIYVSGEKTVWFNIDMPNELYIISDPTGQKLFVSDGHSELDTKYIRADLVPDTHLLKATMIREKIDEIRGRDTRSDVREALDVSNLTGDTALRHIRALKKTVAVGGMAWGNELNWQTLCVIEDALINRTLTRPLDLQGLKREVFGSEIEQIGAKGWNACIDHLAQRGLIRGKDGG